MNKDAFKDYTKECDKLSKGLEAMRNRVGFVSNRLALQNCISEILDKHRRQGLDQKKDGEQLNFVKGTNPHE